MKKTIVLGATPNPTRYAYKAVHKLKANNHEVVPVGIRGGDVAGLPIHTDLPSGRKCRYGYPLCGSAKPGTVLQLHTRASPQTDYF